MKQTKGKWEIKTVMGRSVSIETDKNIVCNFDWGEQYKEDYYPDYKEVEANAKLIASAPELLEALKKIEKMCFGVITEGLDKRLDNIAEVAKIWKEC